VEKDRRLALLMKFAACVGYISLTMGELNDFECTGFGSKLKRSKLAHAHMISDLKTVEVDVLSWP
jgi:hypothetical protein